MADKQSTVIRLLGHALRHHSNTAERFSSTYFIENKICSMNRTLPAEIAPAERLLTAAEFQRLADVPPEIEWFANITNPNSRRAYKKAVGDFIRFAGVEHPEEFCTVTRAHVIAWRDDLARRGLGGATVRHRLAALSSLYEYLCDRNAVTHNPVKGVKRPRAEAIGCHTFRATGITAYLANGGALDHAQEMAAHESPRTTKLYDRTKERLTQDEADRIRL